MTPLDGIIGSSHYFQNYVKEKKELDYMLEHSTQYVAVYLTTSFDDFLLEKPPKWDWSKTYQERLWEYRDRLAMQVIASRLINPNGEGWYLIKLKPALFKKTAS